MAMKDWECKHCGHLTYLHSRTHREGGTCTHVKGSRRAGTNGPKDTGSMGQTCKCPGYQPRKKGLKI